MEIILKTDKKNKTFKVDFISARMVRRTIEVSNGINFENLKVEELDKLVDYIVELFGNQFTRDDVYDGLSSKDLLSTITNCINEVVGGMTESTGGDEKND